MSMRDWITAESEPEQAATFAQADDLDPTAKIAELRQAIESVIRGKPDTVKYALVTLFARGHLLIEDVPGIGKTTLASALARALALSIQRVQFTSDLLPSDVLGVSIFDQRSGSFEWRPGPIFANIVVADEINRATPKTQSALLEAMAEEQVTIDGVSRPLPYPFMVLATQNPSEHHGTYPLPESQLDRFTIRLQMGYPGRADEKKILLDRVESDPIDRLRPVLSQDDVMRLQDRVTSIRVDDALVDYLLEIVEATRGTDTIELGISPRGALALFRSAQSLAMVEGRDFCIADDIKDLVIPCFAHRVILNSRAGGLRGRNREAENALNDILKNISVPL